MRPRCEYLPENMIWAGWECTCEYHVPCIESVSSLKWPVFSAEFTWFIVVRLTMFVTSFWNYCRSTGSTWLGGHFRVVTTYLFAELLFVFLRVHREDCLSVGQTRHCNELYFLYLICSHVFFLVWFFKLSDKLTFRGFIYHLGFWGFGDNDE